MLLLSEREIRYQQTMFAERVCRKAHWIAKLFDSGTRANREICLHKFLSLFFCPESIVNILRSPPFLSHSFGQHLDIHSCSYRPRLLIAVPCFTWCNKSRSELLPRAVPNNEATVRTLKECWRNVVNVIYQITRPELVAAPSSHGYASSFVAEKSSQGPGSQRRIVASDFYAAVN